MARRKPDPDDIDSYLPLPASAMHIIVALAAGERHGYAIMRETNSDLIHGSLDKIGARLVAMIDDVAGQETVAEQFKAFQEKVRAQEVPPEEVENIAANVLNLSNSGSTLTPEQAALMLEMAASAPEATLLPTPAAPGDTTAPAPPLAAASPRPPTAPAPPAPVDRDALAERLEAMIAFDVEVRQAMAERRDVARHIRYRVDEGLHIDIDAEMAEEMAQRLAGHLERLEKRKMVVWKRNMAEEIRAERERARYELRSVEALKRRPPPREVRMAMKNLESLKHLETLGYRPLLSDSIKREIKVHLEEALVSLSEDLNVELADREDLVEEQLDAVEEILDAVQESLEELEEDAEEEDDDDNDE